MQTLFVSTPTRQELYQELKRRSDGSPNAHWFAQILASWLVGEGALPDALGLGIEQYQKLLAHCFPGYYLGRFAASGIRLDHTRLQERQDIATLLRPYAEQPTIETEWVISIIVAACLGSDHLWQDMGLWSRAELSALLTYHFPALVERNVHDMKWKKFLYKQLCDAEGVYVCRAPSCEYCQDYLQCYGEEE